VILVVGGTGHLGVELVPILTAHGLRVRVLTRDPERARRLLGDIPEVALGDARDLRSLEAAVNGIGAVVSAMTGFGPGGPGPRAVDYEGNLNLIQVCETAGARRFVLVSMHGAAPDHPMELLRRKHQAEEALRASRLDWTIVRPTVFMELWAGIIGTPIAKSRKTTVFGRGDNPINFISARDVARFVQLALVEPGFSRQAIDVGGPENLTFNQLVREIEIAASCTASVTHIPILLMRVSRLLLWPIRPDLAGMVEAGIVTDTLDMTFNTTELQRRFPQVELTRVADSARRDFSAGRAP